MVENIKNIKWKRMWKSETTRRSLQRIQLEQAEMSIYLGNFKSNADICGQSQNSYTHHIRVLE